MRNKKSWIALSLGIATFASAGAAFAFSMIPNAKGDNTLPETAYLGETYEIPEKIVSYEGEQVKASVLITAPDGGKMTSNVLSIDQIGLYTIEYYVMDDGQRVSMESDSVMVTRRASDMFEVNETSTAENGSFIYNDQVKGVRLALGNGGVATFSRILDVKDFTRDTALIEFIAEGTKVGDTDFNTMTITLTDVEDSSNQVNIYMTDSGTNCFGYGTYVRVAAPGQVPGGYEGSSFNTYAQFGTPIFHTFKKQADGFEYNIAQMFFDYENKAMYTAPSFLTGRDTIIGDMDDPATYANLWNGFTSGKVRLSISAGGLSAATANIVVTSVLGYDLSQAEIPDTVAPELIVDMAGESNAPNAVLGNKYRVFDTVASDNLDNEVSVEVSAFYQSMSSGSQKTDVSIQDGYFYAGLAGCYTLCYKASDRSGNVTEKEVQVLCTTSGEAISMETTDTDKTVQAQDKVTIGGVESVTATGGSGNLKISVEVFSPSGASVEVKDNAFVAEEVGKYKVLYTATDYLGVSAKKEVIVTVSAPDKPIFAGDLYLPEKFIKDFAYSLPTQIAKEEINGEMVDVPVKVFVNGVEKTDGKFIADGESTEVKYVANGQTGVSERVETVPVVDGNEGKDQEKYFYGNNLDSIVSERDYVTFAFDSEADVSFINVLNTKKFRLGFSYEGTETFTAMKIRLVDAKNKNLSVTLSLRRKEGKWYLSAPYSKVEAEFTASQGSYELTYKNDTKSMTDKNSNSVGAIEFDDNGKAFTGFSDLVYMSVYFEEVNSASAVHFIQLNNQPLGYRSSNPKSRRDRIAPELYMREAYQVKYTLGETAKVSIADAYDVLGYVTNLTVTVIAPDGTVMFDKVSAKETHEILLTQYGNYRVEYYVEDSHGVSYSEGKIITVVEKEKPVLSVDSIKASYKLGDTMRIPSYKLSDNSGDYSLDVILILPNNEMRLLMHDESGEITSKLTADDMTFNPSFKVDANTFRLEKEGKYILRFFAYDSNFNYVTVEQTFTVTK